MGPRSVVQKPIAAFRRALGGRLASELARGAERSLTHGVVLDALRTLDSRCESFDHLSFDQDDVHVALEQYLGREIGLDIIPDHRSALVRRVVRREAIHGELVYAPASDSLHIEIAGTLHASDRKAAHYEELAHIIAGHPVPYWAGDTPAEHRRFWVPERPLCRRRPPFDLERCAVNVNLRCEMIAWCEHAADVWVEHLRAISALGGDVYLRDESIIGL